MHQFKKSMTALDFAALLPNLSNITNSELRNIYRIPNGIFFKLKKPGVEQGLVFGFRIGLFLFTGSKLNILEDDQFTRNLRSFIKGAKLIRIVQHDFDRIAILFLRKEGKELKLYLEWIREGNIILVDEEETIKLAYREREFKDRKIVKGIKYLPPPKIGIDILELRPEDYDKIISRVNQRLKCAAFLSKIINAPGEVIAEALFRSGIDPNSPSTVLNRESFEKFLGTLKEVYEEGRNPGNGYELILNDRVIGVYPFKITHRKGELKKEKFADALSNYFTTLIYMESYREKDIKSKILEKAEEFKERARKLRKIAENLSMNKQVIDKIIDELRKLKASGSEWSEIRERIAKLDPRVIDVDPLKMKISLNIDGEKIELNAKETAFSNISRIFSLAKELEKKAERAVKLAEEKEEIEKEEKTVVLKERKVWYENFHHFVSSEGFLVIGGKDVSQNETLVKKYMEPNDIFLHADIHGGPVVIIKTGNRNVGETTIMEAAQLAAAYSKAWELGLSSVNVYWVMATQVSKKPPSGEYLPKGAFMIYGKRNYLKNVPLELSIGLVLENGEVRIISGPTSAITNEAKIVVILRPGRLSKNLTVKKIVSFFRKALKDRGVRLKIEETIIANMLPKGGFYVFRTITV